jgi:hypothetical protein
VSLPSIIARYNTGTYSVSRDNVAVVNGLASFGSPTTFSIDASVQPLNNKSLRDMPEGQSVDDSLVLFTLTELKLRTATTAPDVVTIGGAKYRVTKATFYGLISNHWRCYLEKTDVP